MKKAINHYRTNKCYRPTSTFSDTVKMVNVGLYLLHMNITIFRGTSRNLNCFDELNSVLSIVDFVLSHWE